MISSDFDDDGVERNRRGRAGKREDESGYVQIFWGTSITTYFKKRHVEHFIIFFKQA